MNKHYLIVKKNNNERCFVDHKELNGFKIKPLNNVSYDGIIVNKMVIVNPSFIDKVLKKKIKRRLDLYLKYLIEILESDDTSSTNLREVLDDVARYKSIVLNNYSKYLEEKYLRLLLKKIMLIENELQEKLKIELQLKLDEQVEEKEETHRRSR